jgi:hypothetical protein
MDRKKSEVGSQKWNFSVFSKEMSCWFGGELYNMHRQGRHCFYDDGREVAA